MNFFLLKQFLTIMRRRKKLIGKFKFKKIHTRIRPEGLCVARANTHTSYIVFRIFKGKYSIKKIKFCNFTILKGN